MGFELVGKVWDEPAFREFLRTQDLSWARGITVHHTASPNHSNRPKGLTIQHIRNIQWGYVNNLGWSSGPHLFSDEDQCFGMSSLESRGVHAKSFNWSHLSLEVLGDYDKVDPQTDSRGKQCWDTAVWIVAALLQRMGKDSSVINGHRDDPRTDKTCPGRLFDLTTFRKDVSEHSVKVEFPSSDREDDEREKEIQAIVKSLDWQMAKLKKLTL